MPVGHYISDAYYVSYCLHKTRRISLSETEIQGGWYYEFQVTVMIEWGKNQNQKKSLGLQTKLQKIPRPKFNPQKIPGQIYEP